MNKTVKWILIILAIAAYIAGALFLTSKLPFLMSGGNPVTQDLLEGAETGKYYGCVFIDGGSVNKKEVVYLYQVDGVNGKQSMCTRTQLSSSNPVIVIDNAFNENGQITVKLAGQSVNGGKFSFGIKFFQIIIFLILILVPLFITISKDGFSALASMGSGGGKGRKKVKTTTKYGNQGTAKYGSVSELKGIMGNDGFTISKKIRLSAKSSYEHCLVLGPTGSGKSSAFFIPNLLDLDGEHSAVVIDPKGEMCEKTRPYLESIGYRIVKIVPLDKTKNEYKYNPLWLTEDDQKIHEIAQIILINGGKSIEIATGSGMSSSEWINMSVPLFSAALGYVKHFGETKSIPEAIDIILRDNLEQMEEKFKKNKFAYRQFLIFKSSAESEKTLSSIKSVLTTNVQIFLEDKIEDFVTPEIEYDEYGDSKINEASMFNPTMLRERPTVLFICVPENQANYMMPITSVLYFQILNMNISRADGCPILCFFDEFPNAGSVLGIDTIISTCRSRRIGISICTQGVEQLKQVYGDNITSTLLNNLKTKLIFAGLTGESAKYVSELSGYTTIETKNYSSGGGGKTMTESLFSGKQVSKSGTRRELYTPDEIRTMPKDQVLVIAHSANPIVDDINAYYTQKRYTSKLD
jgi:type IV secretion system protein VirD4